MNPTVKKILTNALKNAVNAALTAVPFNVLWSSQFSLNNLNGIEHTLGLMLSAAVARELSVYYPMLLNWSNTTIDK
jgi:hypothetical protein